MNRAVKADSRKTAGLSPVPSILRVLIAITATTVMDASGLFNFGALALLPLMLLFWYFERLSPAEMGFRWGRPAQFVFERSTAPENVATPAISPITTNG